MIMPMVITAPGTTRHLVIIAELTVRDVNNGDDNAVTPQRKNGRKEKKNKTRKKNQKGTKGKTKTHRARGRKIKKKGKTIMARI